MCLPVSAHILFVGGDKSMEQLPERTKSRHFPGVFPFCHSSSDSLSQTSSKAMQYTVKCVYTN